MLYIIIIMSRTLRIQEPGATYHVFNRGSFKQPVLRDEAEKAYFLKLLQWGAEKYRIDVFSYCIMDNHYHILLRISTENLSEFMHFIGSSYGNFMVRKGWQGHVFQGRFKSIRIDEEEYFLVANRYIHLNPVEAGIVEKPEEYAWSNYGSSVNGGNESWLNESWLIEYFGPGLVEARARYRQFVGEAIGTGPCYPENKIVAQALLGSEDFLKRIKANFQGKEWVKGVIGRRELTRLFSLAEIHDAVCGYLGIASLGEGDYRNDERCRYACWLLLSVARDCTAASNLEVGEVLGGISANAVGQRFSKMTAALRQDSDLCARLETDKRNVLGLLNVETHNQV